MEKNIWSSKWVFVLAAVGSAAGLGNLWRFPFQVYDNGGAAYLIAYFIMLFFVGFGLLIGEIAFGQKTRGGAPEAMRHISKYFSWLGYFAISMSLFVLSYYMVVLGWGLDYLYYSFSALFSGSFPWMQAGGETFFFTNVLGITDSINESGTFRTGIFIGTVISIILMYFFTFKSAKSVGKVIMVTATFPFVALFILAIRAVTLPGASDGLQYLVNVDMTKLTDAATWSAAGGQIFFTLSVAMGIMFAYGALKGKKTEIVKSVIYVALGNTLVSLFSAVAVFGTLGYLALQNGVPVTDVVTGGPSLVFVVFPEILAKLPAFQEIFAILFYATVFFLAIDSAMSLVEASLISLKHKFPNLRVEFAVLIIILFIFATNFIYLWGNGLYFLDVVDHYVTEVGMLIVGFFEAILFIYGAKKILPYIGERNDFSWMKGTFFLVSWVLGALLLLWLIIANIKSGILVYDTYDSQILFTYGLLPIIMALVISLGINVCELVCKRK